MHAIMLDTVTDSLPPDAPLVDLGPLAWVFDELRKSLEAANKAVQRFVREAEQARLGDLAALDPAPLRLARQQLHQAVGALEAVGLGAPSQMLRAMEAAVQGFVQRPGTCTAQAASTIERASFALIEYLQAMLNQVPVSPVALFAQYREVQELAGAERVHPADLWPFEQHGLNVAPPQGLAPLRCEASLRPQFDRLVLQLVKNTDIASAQQLVGICARLSAGADVPRGQTFWRVAAAFFEAQEQQLLPLDVFVKRATSRILLQFASCARGQTQVSETLLHDLLFFCAQAGGARLAAGSQLQAVQQAFGIESVPVADYQRATLGRFDPALLLKARKRIVAAKEAWSLYAGGDAGRVRAVVEQLGLVADSLLKLHPASTALARSLVRASEQAAREAPSVRTELAMEVATTTLYLEAAFEDFDPDAASMTERTQALAVRLEQVLAGAPAQPLQAWMEQLYRRVSERQTMGSVVGELKVSLAQTEKLLDQFFRKPQEKAGLNLALSQLAQMRGVLSVLGLEQAVQAVTRMRASVEQMLDTEVDQTLACQAGTFEQLGKNLSALGFLVDMLNYQPALAKKLFVFNAEQGELLSLVGQSHSPESAPLAAQQEAQFIGAALERVVDGVVDGAPEGLDLVELSQGLDTPASQVSQAEQAEQGERARAAQHAAQAVVQADAGAASLALVGLEHVAQPLTGRVSQTSAELAAPSGPPEDDLLHIFLEEAREVLASGLQAVRRLRHQKADLEGLSTLRRAFHTLKGSSRMVGLSEFGEAAWAMEQLLNTVLAERHPAESEMIDLSEQALQALSCWVQDIVDGSAAHWHAQAFCDSALAWRTQASYQALLLPHRTEPQQAAPAPPSDALLSSELEVGELDAAAAALFFPDPGFEPDFPPEQVPADPAARQQGPERVDVPACEDGPLQGSDDERSDSEPEPSPLLQEIDFDRLLELSVEVPPPAAAVEDAGAAALPQAEQQAGSPAPLAGVDAPFLGALSDEQVRVVGPLCIGIKLYNVYLNEADEWSRRLCTALDEAALEPQEALPAEAEALAHSLAGSSAAVGFDGLSQLARALEHALESVGMRQQAGAALNAEMTDLFVAAAQEIHALLHQFAAGFLKQPKPELLAALQRVLQQELPAAAGTPTTAAAPEPERAALPPTPQLLSASGGAPSALASEVQTPIPQPALARTVHADAPRAAARQVQDIDDDIDVSDTIDVDLFPIFADEAQELLPRLAAALRQWKAQPDHSIARAEVLRHLHTLKGSARLAGALRLGEMAHRLETLAERLGSELQPDTDLEPLQTAFDAIDARFNWLRRSDSESPGVLLVVPEQSSAAVAAAVAVAPLSALAGLPLAQAPATVSARPGAAVRVRPELLDRLVNQTGELISSRARMESELLSLRGSLQDLSGNLERLRHQLREIELQAETQMQSRLAQARDAELSFDPLEFDRFTRVQELTRMMAESVSDVATVQRNLQRAAQSTEDSLVAQARLTRELQRDLLRTRMVEFEGISERLYRVVRQAAKETGKQVRLDISGGGIEMDRGVLDRMTTAFEHLLRNSVVHGIELPEVRRAAGKAAEGRIDIMLKHELNDVSVVFQDDGAGLDLALLREKAEAQGFIVPGAPLSDQQAADLVFACGLSTVAQVTALAGRGVGMDVVRSEVIALGGRIETGSQAGLGTRFKLVLPLTTAVTQVVMLRAGELTLGVPSHLVELVRRISSTELAQAYASATLRAGEQELAFYWAGALLQSSPHSYQTPGRSHAVVIFRSAAQRVALHVDEVLGNQEVVVKNLGPQLARLPGLAGIASLASGAVALIYNPVALAAVYGSRVPAWVHNQQPSAVPHRRAESSAASVPSSVPLVLVVDDSITVRRVTQRLLLREGYRVALAADGLQAIERMQQERPTVVLSDIEMPRMDGFDLVRNIRNDPRLAALPVIMITSRMAEKHREHARALGVDHYLGKPYAEDELLGLLAHYVHHAALAG